MDRFERFGDLPAELRIPIWEEAAITATNTTPIPQLYRYMLCRTEEEKDQPQSTSPEHIALGTECPWGSYEHESDRFVRPFQDHPMKSKPDILRRKDNYFRSLGNSGLFYACRESQYILVQQLKTLTPGKSATLPVRHDGKDMELLFNTETDVIKLEFTPEYLAVCQALSWEDFRARTPFIRQPANKVSIAFDFDWLQLWGPWGRPAIGSQTFRTSETCWNYCFDEPSLIKIIAQAVRAWVVGELPEDTKIWLIDREGTRPLLELFPSCTSSEHRYRYYQRQYDSSIGKVLLADEHYDYVAGIGQGMDCFIRLPRGFFPDDPRSNIYEPGTVGERVSRRRQLCLMPVIPVPRAGRA